jgi:hypothetical protein
VACRSRSRLASARPHPKVSRPGCGWRLTSYAGASFLASPVPVPVLDASQTLGLEPADHLVRQRRGIPSCNICSQIYMSLSCLGLAPPDLYKLVVPATAIHHVKLGPILSSPAAPRHHVLSATKIACLVTSSPHHLTQAPPPCPLLLASNEPLLRRGTYSSSHKAAKFSPPAYTRTSLCSSSNFSIATPSVRVGRPSSPSRTC